MVGRIRYASSTAIFDTYIEDMSIVLEFNFVFSADKALA